MGKLNTGVMLNTNHVSLVCSVERQMLEEENTWVRKLISKGVSASHPDDGHVNNEFNYIDFSYPQFKFTLNVGNLVMLGSYYGDCRLVEVIKIGGVDFFGTYVEDRCYFKELNIVLDDLLIIQRGADFMNNKNRHYDKKKLK